MALQHLEHLGIHFDKQRNRDLASGLEAAISSPDSPIKVFVIPTNEELVFIEDVAAF